MTNAMKNHVTCTSRAHNKGALYSHKGELEKLDREAGHDYVPMDVFIDPRTMKEHFQESSIRTRLTGTHSSIA